MSRRSGRTTLAIWNAPLGAIYICCNACSRDHARRIAQEIGRDDIQFESIGWIENDKWRGVKAEKIIIDHATEEEIAISNHARNWNIINMLRARWQK